MNDQRMKNFGLLNFIQHEILSNNKYFRGLGYKWKSWREKIRGTPLNTGESSCAILHRNTKRCAWKKFCIYLYLSVLYGVVKPSQGCMNGSIIFSTLREVNRTENGDVSRFLVWLTRFVSPEVKCVIWKYVNQTLKCIVSRITIAILLTQKTKSKK